MDKKLSDQFPSECWDCKFARRTWAIALEDKGYVGCSYLLNENLKMHIGKEKRIKDLFDFTDVDKLQEGWITQRKPLDRSENGGMSTFNYQPILHSVINCKLKIQN